MSAWRCDSLIRPTTEVMGYFISPAGLKTTNISFANDAKAFDIFSEPLTDQSGMSMPPAISRS